MHDLRAHRVAEPGRSRREWAQDRDAPSPQGVFVASSPIAWRSRTCVGQAKAMEPRWTPSHSMGRQQVGVAQHTTKYGNDVARPRPGNENQHGSGYSLRICGCAQASRPALAPHLPALCRPRWNMIWRERVWRSWEAMYSEARAQTRSGHSSGESVVLRFAPGDVSRWQRGRRRKPLLGASMQQGHSCMARQRGETIHGTCMSSPSLDIGVVARFCDPQFCSYTVGQFTAFRSM